MNDGEFAVAGALCDIVTEILRVSQAPSPGGIFWGEVETNTAHLLHVNKSRSEIDHSMLLVNRFRDFPTVIYEFDVLTPKPDFWVQRYLRLCKGAPKLWHVKIPPRFGEIGWNVNGFPVNRHTATLQERVNMQLYFGMEKLLRQPNARVLEIGGGSGEMAYTICNAVPDITWYDCDLSQSLIYNAIHMAIWLPKKKHYIYVGNLPVKGVDERYILRSSEEAARVKNAVINIPHFLLDDFDGQLSLKMALNAWSFSEMPQSEVQRYGRFLQAHLAEDGMLVEQNGMDTERNGCDVKAILTEFFPVRRSSQTVFRNFEGRRIMDGSIDTWSKVKIPVADDFDATFYDNHGVEPDFTFPPNAYGLVDEILAKNSAR